MRKTLTLIFLLLLFNLLIISCVLFSDTPQDSNSDLPTAGLPDDTTRTNIITPTSESVSYSSDVVRLMRAINARQQVLGLDQSTWGLSGVPDGGRDYPLLDVLDGVVDLEPYMKDLQFAAAGLIVRFDAPTVKGAFWNHKTGAPYVSLEDWIGMPNWQSDPVEGNLEEIRLALEELDTVVFHSNGIAKLVRFASRDTIIGTEWYEFYSSSNPEDWDMDNLQEAMRHTEPRSDAPGQSKYAPNGPLVGQYLAYIYPSTQLSRAFLSFDTSSLISGPGVSSPVLLQLKHLMVISQTNWTLNPPQEVRAASVGIGVNAGAWDLATKTGTGWGLGPAEWNFSAAERERAWDSCPINAASLSVGTVGVQDGYDMFMLQDDLINSKGLTQFRIALQDETNLANPGWRNSIWRLYSLSGNVSDHLLIIPLKFPILDPMPSSFS